jgi:bifunctional non-homologous end joining protein LigD
MHKPRAPRPKRVQPDILRGAAPRSVDPRQSDLFHDPMPDRVEPCLATLVPKIPTGPNWAYEIKWDGYRLALHIAHGKAKAITRGGHDWSERFPAIIAAAEKLPIDAAIIDGEAVVLDERGVSSFSGLQQALGGRGGKRRADEAIFYGFDLLYMDGHDLRNMELDERRQMLESLTGDGAIRMSEEIGSDAYGLLDRACHLGLEGIIAKRRDAPYRSGRGKDWLKIKCTQSESFAIVGYEASPAALGGLGRLYLAARQGDKLVYVGGVGTGFNYRTATDLLTKLKALRVSKAPVAHRSADAMWVAPELIAEIEFRGWTDDQKLRHPSFKGLRDRDDASNIYEF